ncbi:MAG: hypothetical protein PHS14_00420 [Elusimicrobia bacterium]|nr:hypothetical protein [Elusimicrobiota bacterium]
MIHTIIKTRRGKTSEVSGTIAELTKYFGYTLLVGHSYNSRISLKPRTAESLVTNLNRAIEEKQRGSFDPDYYALKVEVPS